MLLEYRLAAKRLIISTQNLTFDSLLTVVKKELNLSEEQLKIQIFDRDFNTFCDMENISELKHLSRLKINDETINDISTANFEDAKWKTDEEITDPNLRKKSCTNVNNFCIPLSLFSQISREELTLAKELFENNNKLHTASYKLKAEIHDILSKEVTEYGLYPTDEMYTIATKKLVEKYPFLKDSIGEGYYCWKIALKYRVQEIRRKSKVLETKINAGNEVAETAIIKLLKICTYLCQKLFPMSPPFFT